jgi:NTP pyrophosphatase (non-canonical NTP hydrolase)
MLSIDEMPAGREMDLLIDRELFKKKNLRAYHKIFTGRYIDSDRKLTPYQQSELDAGNYGPWEQLPAPHYSTDIAAAWRLLEHIKKSVKITVYEPNDTALDYVCVEWYGGQWNVVLGFTPSEDERYYGTADTLPLAICRATVEMYVEWIKEGIMSFNKYQQLAEKTAARGPSDTTEQRFINFGFGLMGETGEVVDCLKKILFHGHDLEDNREKLKHELGDCLWYIATIATTAGISLDEVAKANIEKLKARYPEGFSEERSINREG